MNISKLKLGKRYISNITAAVQGAGKNPRLQMQQIDPALIGSQYLIAEGTMALNIILTIGHLIHGRCTYTAKF